MLNLIYGLQAVLLSCILIVTGASIAGAQWLTPYFMPLLIVLMAVILTTRGGMTLMHDEADDALIARMYMRGILCGILATMLYIMIV